MPTVNAVKELEQAVEKITGVLSIEKIRVNDGIIRYIAIESEKAGEVTVEQLDVSDAAELYDFYLSRISERSRRLFIPYPLFHTLPTSSGDLAQRIKEWKKEDDWSALKLVKAERIIGFGLLKRIRSEQVTSAIVIADDYLRMGMGYLLQTIINAQARLLGLQKFHVKIISDNQSSVRLHEKCGFKKVGIVPWDGYEDLRDFLSANDTPDANANRQIIEMVIELDVTKNQ
jgi:RimJ/RimL family protein N-acetyltransferase